MDLKVVVRMSRQVVCCVVLLLVVFCFSLDSVAIAGKGCTDPNGINGDYSDGARVSGCKKCNDGQWFDVTCDGCSGTHVDDGVETGTPCRYAGQDDKDTSIRNHDGNCQKCVQGIWFDKPCSWCE